MRIEKVTISNDPEWYEAWPDVALSPNGNLICVFNECTHHCDRTYTRLMLTESSDRGRTWTPKHPLTEAARGLPYYYNCPRISTLSGGRLAIIADRIPREGESAAGKAENVVYYSSDGGTSWSPPCNLPMNGIVPDKIRELDTGRMVISAHYPYRGKLAQFLHYSDDGGKSWSDEILVAFDPRYNLCEASLLPLGAGVIVAFIRENTCHGYDCFKTISYDHGETWGPLHEFPLPACHRPVAGFLQDGRIFITYRFIQGGGNGMGARTQNFFAALTDRSSALAIRRSDASTRIIPIDYDASPKADLGYSGWVQFPDGEIYIVNYIVDDAFDKGQIRGYALAPHELVVDQNTCNVSRAPAIQNESLTVAQEINS